MTSEIAQARYRAAWLDYVGETNDGVKQRLEDVMDSLQAHICDCANNPIWQNFRNNLPGFNEHWAGMRAECLAKVEDFIRRERAKENN